MIPLDGSLADWGTFAVVLTTFVGLAGYWIKGIPDRGRARNEEKVIDNTEAAAIRAEFADLNKQARNDIHELRDELQKVMAQQRDCDKALAAAHAENLTYRDDMNTLFFLVRLLICEIKRLDPNPDNMIIKQAEMMLGELDRRRLPHGKSAEEKAKKTVLAAKETLDELKAEDVG